MKRLKLTHDLDSLVVLGSLVWLQVVVELLSVLGDVGSAGSLEVRSHSLVVREERGGGTNLGTHVTDSSHTGTRQRLDTWTVVLNDGTCSTLDGEDTGDLEDDVCRHRQLCLWRKNCVAHPLASSNRSSFRQGRHR